MTVIAALAMEDRVIMGCDTAVNQDGTVVYGSRGKIAVRVLANGERILIGSAGNSAIHAVLARQWTVPPVPLPSANDGDADRWADTCAEEITTLLAEANPPVMQHHSDSATTLDGCLLLAWRQHVWTIYTHSALRPTNSIAAIGSGKELALGYLLAAARYESDPRVSVNAAVEAACAHDGGCGVDDRGPIIHSTLEN